MNKVILMGRLTADPVLSQTSGGVSTCKFTIAIDRPFTDKNTGERQADFIRCTAWDKSAENIERYFKKGRMIMVEGSLRTGSYQDKKYSDVTHYTTDVFVERWEFCGEKNPSGNANFSAPQNDNNNRYNNGYQASPQSQQAQNNESMSYGNLNDFEEILNDGDVPF